MLDAELKEITSLCKKLMPFLEKVRGDWKAGDRFFWVEREDFGTCERDTDGAIPFETIDDDFFGDVFVWIPPLYDPLQPKRSLWGMINWQEFDIASARDGDINVWNHKVRRRLANDESPVIALLKAIQYQANQGKRECKSTNKR